MDPAIELATLVVSYLWPLRELYPEVKQVRGFIDMLPRLEQGAGRDFALVARLRDVASRTTDEAWTVENGDAEYADPGADLDAILGDRLARTRTGHRETRLQRARSEIEELIRRVHEDPTEGDHGELVARYLGRFKRHARGLCEHPCLASLDVRSEDVTTPGSAAAPPASPELTRDRLSTLVAVQLLRGEGLAAMAIALNFCPLILRELRDAVPAQPGAGMASMQALLEDPDYPRKLTAQCRAAGIPLPFSLAAHDELDEVQRQRERRRGVTPKFPPATLATYRGFNADLLGLCLSGGGIRSATFALGVLQGLANRAWLPHIDYLSTVSGGGYIGSWLVSWIKRRGSVQSVQGSLQGYHSCAVDGNANNPDPGAEHLRPIRLLREYSNYLAPQAGAFSTDTWTIGAIWLRNTLLNLLTLTLFLMAALMLPRALGLLFVNADLTLSIWACRIMVAASAILVGLNLRTFAHAPTTAVGGMIRRSIVPRSTATERGDTSFLILSTIVVPMLAAGFFAMRALWRYWEGVDISTAAGLETATKNVFLNVTAMLWGGIALTAVCSQTLVQGSALHAPASKKRLLRRAVKRTVVSILSGLAPALIGALIVAKLWERVLPELFADTHRGIWLIVALGPFLFITVVGLVIILYLGFEGLAAADERREWWSRLGAWLSIVGVAWAVVTTIAYFSPYLLARGGISLGSAVLSWGGLTAAGAWLASSGKSNGINLAFDRNRLTSLVIAVAPYVFLLGFLVGVTVLTQVLEFWLRTETSGVGSPPFSLLRFSDTYWASMTPEDVWAPFVAALLLIGAFLLAWRVDVNEFSMHHFYKNRLVRAYLGASRSRRHRRPNAFTGLDMDDDIKLWRFTTGDASTLNDAVSDCRSGYDGPFPIINATLNMTTGDELAYRERKGQSFVFTPLHCGYDFATKQTLISETVLTQFALRPADAFGASPGRWSGSARTAKSDTGLGIGTAVAISGAAANPNAGYHSSPAVAFLLTVFNARLGWWIGNPRRSSWSRASPGVGLTYLLSDLFGFSGTQRDYVNLSDGGHFDNMGLYELVRRRCRCIIVCDGEQDDHYSFNGLAGAIRKCRLDFGVVINIDTQCIRPSSSGQRSAAHVAVGTISYPEGCGTIVYIKASMTGDEPMDVREYHSAHQEFPHQTTGDQFFGESQFESYRALGQHIADAAFPEWTPQADEQWDQTLKRQFEDISRRH